MKTKNHDLAIKAIRLFMITFLIVISKVTLAQFTTVKYDFDSVTTKWNKTILLTLNKSDSTDTTTTIIKPFKESVLDSFGIKKIEIFPHETNDSLNLKVNIISVNSSPITGTIKVLNTAGTTVYINHSILAHNNLNFKVLAIGFYLLRIEINGQIRKYKVLKN